MLHENNGTNKFWRITYVDNTVGQSRTLMCDLLMTEIKKEMENSWDNGTLAPAILMI